MNAKKILDEFLFNLRILQIYDLLVKKIDLTKTEDQPNKREKTN